MEHIKLTNQLNIKKLDPNNNKDVHLIEELDQDEAIRRYLWPLKNAFKDTSYLQNGDIYQSSFTIYHNQDAIGFLEISKIFQMKAQTMVNLCYALKKSVRKQGYMAQTLSSISDIILSDPVNHIDTVMLIMDPQNEESKQVAVRSGFVSDGLTKEEHLAQGYIAYSKVKKF